MNKKYCLNNGHEADLYSGAEPESALIHGVFHIRKLSILFVVFLLILFVPMKFYFVDIHKSGLHKSVFSILKMDSAMAKDKKNEKDKNKSKSDKDKKQETGQKNKDTNKDDKTRKRPCPECPKCPDPAKVVFKGLEKREAAIAMAEGKIKNERKELNKLKDQLDDKLDKLSKLKKQIETDLADLNRKKTAAEQQKQAAFEAKMDRLVKMYSGMKPKNAAKIVDKLDLEVAKRIFSRMRETSAAQILAYVESEKAAKISERIAYKKP